MKNANDNGDYYVTVYEWIDGKHTSKQISQKKLLRQHQWNTHRGFILFMLTIFGIGLLAVMKIITNIL